VDTSQLERLSALTRALIASTRSPLVRLYYWQVFLDLYLESGIRSPVYLEDALPEMTELLQRSGADLADLEFAAQLARTAQSQALPDTEMTRAFRSAVAAVQHPHRPAPDGAEPELDAAILLVPAGRELLGHKPELSVPTTLSVRASAGFRKPGEIVWRIAREENDPIESVAGRALTAARREAGVKRSPLAYEVRLQRADWQIRGASLGLALAVLFYLFEKAEKRGAPRVLAPDVAILGSVDEQGAVLPVAEATLAAKIRAAFGAGYRKIVLPAENLAVAQREIARLCVVLPDVAAPILVPVTTLREVVSSTELFVQPERPVKHLIVRVRTTRWVVGIGVGLALLGSLFWFRPRTWTVENTTITSNLREFFVTARLAGFPPRESRWKLDTSVGWATIFTMPGRRQAALVVGTNADGPHPARLYCYELGSRRLLWERNLCDPLELGKPTRSTVTMQIAEILAADVDDDGRQDLVVVVQTNPMSPCFVYWLRADGTTRSIYAHRGYLFYARAVDYTMDGRTEIFLAGTSNFDGHPLNQNATLVVLDRDHFSGWPGDGPFEGSSRAPFDSCLARVIFPPVPEHCRIMGTPGYYVNSYYVHASQTDPSVTVAVGSEDHPGLVVTLDRDFHAVRVVAEDNLGPYVQEALEKGTIAEDFTTRERLAGYMREVRRVR
jgi:hypothetical protein